MHINILVVSVNFVIRPRPIRDNYGCILNYTINQQCTWANKVRLGEKTTVVKFKRHQYLGDKTSQSTVPKVSHKHLRTSPFRVITTIILIPIKNSIYPEMSNLIQTNKYKLISQILILYQYKIWKLHNKPIQFIYISL